MENYQNCLCTQKFWSGIKTSNIDYYYSGSNLYPSLSNRENVIITAETTVKYFEEYCQNNDIKAFDKRSIDSVVAVAMAAKMGNISLLDYLVVEIGNEILNTSDRNDFTPLHIICHETRVQNGIYNIEQICKGAKRLIELGANPNAASSEGFTPLTTSALREDNMPLTDLLLQNQGKLTSCVSHLKIFVEGSGFISCESTIKENIRKIARPPTRPPIEYITVKDMRMQNLDQISGIVFEDLDTKAKFLPVKDFENQQGNDVEKKYNSLKRQYSVLEESSKEKDLKILELEEKIKEMQEKYTSDLKKNQEDSSN